MKKFLFKMFMALLPILVYIILFVAFEPYNYWGIKQPKTGNWYRPLARVMEFKRHPSEYIILGDSRMNHFDLDYVEELTGNRYANLSVGGAGINLTYELYEWALQYVEPKEVVVDVSFYQMLGGKSDSASKVFYIADHPLQYIVTRDYVVEAFEQMLNSIMPSESSSASELSDEIQEIIDDDTKYRDDLLVYTFWHIVPYCLNYQYSEEALEYLENMADDINGRGGEIIFVAPPVQECIWDYVIEPCNIEEQMIEYKNILLDYGTIYDFEWKSEFAKNQDYYDDGFHFNATEPYSIFTEAIFTGKSDFMHIMEKGSLLE